MELEDDQINWKGERVFLPGTIFHESGKTVRVVLAQNCQSTVHLAMINDTQTSLGTVKGSGLHP